MLIGTGHVGSGTPAGNGSANAGQAVFDVGYAEFEARVLRASMDVPILVDFWAPWCQPCKQLMPVLEEEVRAAGGKVLLAKVNLDENPELASALNVRSVPSVFAFFQGRPVGAFQGNRPRTDIRTLISQLVEMARQSRPDAIDVPALLKQAGEFLASGDSAQAQDLYVQVLSEDENNAEAYAGLLRTFVAEGDREQAGEMIANVPDPVAKHPAFQAAKTAFELMDLSPVSNTSDLEHRLQGNPDDHSARFDLAMSFFSQGKKDEAVDALMEIIAREKDWEEGKAREQLLKFFEAFGPADPATLRGRRKLSSLLFS